MRFPPGKRVVAPITAETGTVRGYTRPSLTELVEWSRRDYEHSYAKADDDDAKAWAAFSLNNPDLVGAPYTLIAAHFFLGRWREQGLPRVVLGPRRSASLMSTGVSADQMSNVFPPWKAFLVEINDSPISVRDPKAGTRAPVDRLMLHYADHHTGQPAWTMIAETSFGTSLQRFNVQVPEWINDDLEYTGPADAYSADVDDEDLRALSVLSRLVAGMCFSLSTPEQRDDAARRGKSKGYRARRRGPPMLRDYVLGDDVRIDVRDAVGEYVAGGGKTPTVQSLVRGHWKWQPHGPERKHRKWIHVEPYWRGPEDAPIVMRRHKVVED